jgi:hypothetical protein
MISCVASSWPVLRSWRPQLDHGTGRLSWPVVILYPEGSTQDEVQAWDEAATVGEQLDQVCMSVCERGRGGG